MPNLYLVDQKSSLEHTLVPGLLAHHVFVRLSVMCILY